MTTPSSPYKGLFRACSGQSRGKHQWGICLAQYDVLPWWRHETSNGRTALYASFESAQRAIAKLERGPLPARLAEALAKQRAARAKAPAWVTTRWHTSAGLTCHQCGIEGVEAPVYPGPEFRVRVLLPGYDHVEGKVIPWHRENEWHILTDKGSRISFYPGDEGRSWERLN